ncbi:MAG: tryptophan 2,3-dioxygenase family protein [Planctomycetota bacterium]
MTPHQRTFEDQLTTDLHGKLDYATNLGLPQLLNAQKPLSHPQHHDELLFIIQHQTSELWMMLVIHELRAALDHINHDRLSPCFKILARVKQVLRQLFEQWAVLETLTPTEYMQFRHVLGPASGFQSAQYRTIEFLLGNKDARMIKVFAHDEATSKSLQQDLEQPSLYEAFLAHLDRAGLPIPEHAIKRDFTEPRDIDEQVLSVFETIYTNPSSHWNAYEMAEKLIDIDEQLSLWRFRHMKTVERVIGFKRGTGGSAGVAFLKQVVDLRLFPELWEVRTHLKEQPSQ